MKNISRTFSMSDKVKFRACCKFWVVTLPGSDQRPICLRKGKHAGDEGKYKRCSNPYNQKFGKLKHSKYQTLITKQISSYIIVFTMSIQLNHFMDPLYWKNIFFLKCWCSSWLGGREGAYKEMRITAYEHNQLLFFLIRRALHYSYFSNFNKYFRMQSGD